MNRFWEDAVSVFETASNAGWEDGAGELNILIDGGGVLRMIAGEGWQLDALRAHYGARTVYQVTHTANGVRVAGRSMGVSCRLESVKPASILGGPGSGLAHYRVEDRLLGPAGE